MSAVVTSAGPKGLSARVVALRIAIEAINYRIDTERLGRRLSRPVMVELRDIRERLHVELNRLDDDDVPF